VNEIKSVVVVCFRRNIGYVSGEWTIRHDVAGVENAGVDNAGVVKCV